MDDVTDDPPFLNEVLSACWVSLALMVLIGITLPRDRAGDTGETYAPVFSSQLPDRPDLPRGAVRDFPEERK